MMTDDRMDALIRRLDVPATPDPAFVAATASYLRPRVRAARVEDMTRIGRLRRDLRLGLAGRTTWTRPPLAVVVGLVLLAAFAAALAAGALDRRHDLLQDVRGAGTLRVAVRPDRPQISAPGAPRSGFDVDIATELGRRLGLRVSPRLHPRRSDGWAPRRVGRRPSFVSLRTRGPGDVDGVLRLAHPADRPRQCRRHDARRPFGIGRLRRVR